MKRKEERGKEGRRGREKETFSISNIDDPTANEFQFTFKFRFIFCGENNMIAQQNHANLGALLSYSDALQFNFTNVRSPRFHQFL